MNPLYVDPEGKHVFSTDQVDTYGCPSISGFTNFIVITAQPIYMYAYNQTGVFKTKRLVHYYSRYERFRLTLNQLTGLQINISHKVLNSTNWLNFITELRESRFTGKEPCWVFARSILKKYNLTKYYNRIPALLALIDEELVGFTPKTMTKKQYTAIINDFVLMNEAFELTLLSHRRYFFNIRFVVLMLMAKHNVVNYYKIPLLITKTKRIQLVADYEFLWAFINFHRYQRLHEASFQGNKQHQPSGVVE